jgi:hypothetical protein
MYPSHMPFYCSHPNCQDAYSNSVPYQEENYYHSHPSERQFGSLFPPFGPPSGPPGGAPPFAPPGQGQGSGAPTSPPPSFVPQQQAQTFAVDPGGIARCLFRHTYVWLRGFQEFWFFPIFVGRNSVTGWRWTGFRWVYFGISLRQIQSFTCF